MMVNLSWLDPNFFKLIYLTIPLPKRLSHLTLVLANELHSICVCCLYSNFSIQFLTAWNICCVEKHRVLLYRLSKKWLFKSTHQHPQFTQQNWGGQITIHPAELRGPNHNSTQQKRSQWTSIHPAEEVSKSVWSMVENFHTKFHMARVYLIMCERPELI